MENGRKRYGAIVGLVILVFGFFTLHPETSTIREIESGTAQSTGLPRIAIMDIMSSQFERNRLKTLTDVLRTELFKLHVFQVLERGLIEQILMDHNVSMTNSVNDSDLVSVGEFLAVDKLVICRLEYFSELIALNIRIIDVRSSLIDFTENVFIQSEEELFSAIKEVTKKIELFYVVKKGDDSSPAKRLGNVKKTWTFIGATEEQTEILLAKNIKPDVYLDIRQYDISFDFTAFMQAGISYP